MNEKFLMEKSFDLTLWMFYCSMYLMMDAITGMFYFEFFNFMGFMDICMLCSFCFIFMVKSPVYLMLLVMLMFILMGIGFILMGGLAYVGYAIIIAYVGAVAVLFLFIVMMLNVRDFWQDSNMEMWKIYIMLLLVISLSMLFLYFDLLDWCCNYIAYEFSFEEEEVSYNKEVDYLESVKIMLQNNSLSKDEDLFDVDEKYVLSKFCEALYNTNPLHLILCGLLLYVGLLGPMVLTLRVSKKMLINLIKSSELTNTFLDEKLVKMCSIKFFIKNKLLWSKTSSGLFMSCNKKNLDNLKSMLRYYK